MNVCMSWVQWTARARLTIAAVQPLPPRFYGVFSFLQKSASGFVFLLSCLFLLNAIYTTEVSVAEREPADRCCCCCCCIVAVVVDRSSTRAGFHHDEVTLVLLVLNSLSNYIQSYALVLFLLQIDFVQNCAYRYIRVSFVSPRTRYLDSRYRKYPLFLLLRFPIFASDISVFSLRFLSLGKKTFNFVCVCIHVYMCARARARACVCVPRENIRRTVPKIDMTIIFQNIVGDF